MVLVLVIYSLQNGFPTEEFGQSIKMSECDKLKLKKMYECDIGDEYTEECLDTCETGTQLECTSSCDYYKMMGMCDGSHHQPFVQRNCKKTCNLCDVCMDNYRTDKCKKLSYDGRCCEKEVMKNCMKTCNLCGII